MRMRHVKKDPGAPRACSWRECLATPLRHCARLHHQRADRAAGRAAVHDVVCAAAARVVGHPPSAAWVPHTALSWGSTCAAPPSAATAAAAVLRAAGRAAAADRRARPVVRRHSCGIRALYQWVRPTRQRKSPASDDSTTPHAGRKPWRLPVIGCTTPVHGVCSASAENIASNDVHPPPETRTVSTTCVGLSDIRSHEHLADCAIRTIHTSSESAPDRPAQRSAP